MNRTIACPNHHPVQVPALPGYALSGGISVVTRSAEDEFLDCTLCGPFRQDGHGHAESIIDRIANGVFHRDLVKANHAVIETLMSGETDVDTIGARTGIDDHMLQAVLANADVYEVETGMNEPTVLVSAKLTPYGRTLGHIAHNERVRWLPRVLKNVPCPKCRKEHTISVIEGIPFPTFKTEVGAVICNGCCGFTVDEYGRVYP